MAGFGPEPPAFLAQGILVNGDGFLVGEDGGDFGGHLADIVAGDQRCGEDAPKAEMCARLGKGQALVANLEHVGVVPMAGAGIFADAIALAVGGLHLGILEVEDDFPALLPTLLAIIAVHDVASRAPEMANILGPFPGFGAAPFADTENDGPLGRVKGVAHAGVSVLGVGVAGVAPIVFEVVHAPLRVLEGVLEFMAPAAGIAAAGFGAGAIINAELEAARVQVVTQRLHSAGKLDRVRLKVALGIALHRGPSVVEHDVIVAGVPHAVFDHGLGGLFDHELVNLAGEGVPGVKAHGGREDEAFEFLGIGRDRQNED